MPRSGLSILNANDNVDFEVADYFPAEWLEESPALVAA